MISDTSRERGILSERLVASALLKLKREGLIEDYVWVSKSSSRSASDVDKRGIDFLVVRKGLGLPLQVKTSSKQHTAGYKKKRRDIPVVTVGKSQELMIAEERTRAVISDAPDTLWQKKWHDLYLERFGPR
ncbi:MAG: hypothetical protein Greene071421_79 [Parcubacteria group bacterium Greene0714_21]|nr:MAG: hypothetical protein Greene041639_530 [Parcubacteria group bacterium Greene0416_39]TSC97769.1 MAG: hypothetical protein Greene101447_305 [Parcubacteria group bacterium Greene1014_47]TSD04243.1 MAG: hypothetical protein Greene071421_79 [Parcubacteria group bacterium Greene0714_21]